MKVYFDGTGEERGKAFQELIEMMAFEGFHLIQQKMNRGDFFIEGDSSIIIERKTVADFLGGMKNNHNRLQLAKLHNDYCPGYERPFFVIIGEEKEIYEDRELRKRYTQGQFRSAKRAYQRDYPAVCVTRVNDNKEFIDCIKVWTAPKKETIDCEFETVGMKKLSWLTRALMQVDGIGLDKAERLSTATVTLERTIARLKISEKVTWPKGIGKKTLQSIKDAMGLNQ